MVVERMKQRQMQRVRFFAQSNPALGPAGRIVQRHRPAVPVSRNRHPVGSERMQFARRASFSHLDIGVAGNHQVAEHRLQKRPASLLRIRPRHQRQRRVLNQFPAALQQQPGH
jgi:hypothetical protein